MGIIIKNAIMDIQLKKEIYMSQETKAMLKSWLNVFVAAVITALLVVIVDSQTLALDGKALEAVLIAGLVAVLPVIKNYFDPNDPRYGRVSLDTTE
jgi:branched-subunit amino acid transport protein